MANVVERLVNGYVIRIEGQRPVYFEVADDITLADICPKPWPNEFAFKLEEIIPLDQMSCMVKEPYVAEPEQEGPKARVFFPDNGDTIEGPQGKTLDEVLGKKNDITCPAPGEIADAAHPGVCRVTEAEMEAIHSRFAEEVRGGPKINTSLNPNSKVHGIDQLDRHHGRDVVLRPR
jgi:hypothetical protein